MGNSLLAITKNNKSYNIGDIIMKIEGLEEEKVLVLNNVAAFIWQLIEATPNIDIINLIAETEKKFDVSRETLVRDVRIFLESLIYLEMLQNIELSFDGLQDVEVAASRESYRPPKIYIYDLKTDEETPFGPHIKGRTFVHRAITKSWHGGCC